MTAPETIKSAAELVQCARKVYGTNGRGVPYDLPSRANEWWRACFDPAACLRQIKIGLRDGKSLPEIDKAIRANHARDTPLTVGRARQNSGEPALDTLSGTPTGLTTKVLAKPAEADRLPQIGGSRITARPLNAAERVRLYRKRRRNGLHLLRVLIGKPEIESLIRKEYLKQERRDDQNAVRHAIERVISHVLGTSAEAS